VFTVVGMAIAVREEQEVNEEDPIIETDVGMEMEVREEQE
jgi:hypothetical protein